MDSDTKKSIKEDENTINLKLFEEEEIIKEQPKPISQSEKSKILPKMGGKMRKFRSSDAVKKPLRIPLDEIDDDFVARDIKPEQNISLTDTKNAEADTIQMTGAKKLSSASKIIGDIKKKIKHKGQKSVEISEHFTHQKGKSIGENNSNNENCSKNNEHKNIQKSVLKSEEEKLSPFKNSMNSSDNIESNITSERESIYSEEEDFDPYSYEAENFDEAWDYTPFGNYGLDEIPEEEDAFEVTQSETKKHSINELKWKISEKKIEIKEMVQNDENLEKCYNYLSKIIKWEDDINNSSKFQDIHVFVKKLGIKNYKDVIFEWFQLRTLENDLKDMEEE